MREVSMIGPRAADDFAIIRARMDELRREPDHWFVALKRITGADPVPAEARGDLDRMAEAWLNWSRDHGIEK